MRWPALDLTREFVDGLRVVGDTLGPGVLRQEVPRLRRLWTRRSGLLQTGSLGVQSRLLLGYSEAPQQGHRIPVPLQVAT